ncbi:hypothetical protein [Cellulomonas sp. Leaf334]|uniref:hypothetical protein n=1 Tax=Cellulomonas sp. Leaf334 TaxID=1736339 RepID=UPI0006FF1644|nr:hypothetical protein [Cellulomonas sp. Leaf334]KQR08582.1 hypothetical protein ASF78_20285 [Cellulomonas sp. Leaf334]
MSTGRTLDAAALGERPVGRLLWHACTQTTIAVGVYGIYALTNAWFVARGVGTTAMAAVNLVAPLLLALGAVSTAHGRYAQGARIAISFSTLRTCRPRLCQVRNPATRVASALRGDEQKVARAVGVEPGGGGEHRAPGGGGEHRAPGVGGHQRGHTVGDLLVQGGGLVV